MGEYQVLARKYRPKTFKEVLGQEAIVTTLKNAIKWGRIAHAYLFSGSRGTGKTTLARIFAKALNCQQPSPELEPCNQCASCKEITSGSSLDVLEIDGASHRGIEDIRQINETAGYAASSGKYKIYIIDEVHMLTKEAFNALLKTLEEPPPKVKFFFATTEPQKVLPTILSRCQRFQLNRLLPPTIMQKLQTVTQELQLTVEEDALRLIANMADGGLRDAESLFDQVLSFHEGLVTTEVVASILGVMPREVYFELDQAGREGDIAKAFELADRLFSQGKDVLLFIDGLIDHFRTLLLVKLAGKEAPFLSLSTAERERYAVSSKGYTQEQCTFVLDFLIEAQQHIRFAPSTRIALEALLMRVLRSHQRVPLDVIVKRLCELEEQLRTAPKEQVQPEVPKPPTAPPPPITAPPSPIASVSEDPTPQPADLEFAPPKQPAKAAAPRKEIDPKIQSRYDTLLQFAAVELEGSVHKKTT